MYCVSSSWEMLALFQFTDTLFNSQSMPKQIVGQDLRGKAHYTFTIDDSRFFSDITLQLHIIDY